MAADGAPNLASAPFSGLSADLSSEAAGARLPRFLKERQSDAIRGTVVGVAFGGICWLAMGLGIALIS